MPNIGTSVVRSVDIRHIDISEDRSAGLGNPDTHINPPQCEQIKLYLLLVVCFCIKIYTISVCNMTVINV